MELKYSNSNQGGNISGVTQSQSRNELSRLGLEHQQLAMLNISASLKGSTAWHNGNIEDSMKLENWKFAKDIPDGLQQLMLENYLSQNTLLDRLLEIDNLIGPVTRYDNFVRQKMVQISVSDNKEDVVKKTSEWSDFNLDEKGLDEASSHGSNALYSCVRVNIHVTDWSSLLSKSQYTRNGYLLQLDRTKTGFESNIFNQPTSPSVSLYQDKLGLYVGQYSFVTDSGLVLTVRLTNLADLKEAINIVDIVRQHTKLEGFQDVSSEIRGFIFHSVKLPIIKPMTPALGAYNGDREIVGIQANGIFQINKSTPLYLECRSVVVEATRSCGSVNKECYYEFFQTHKEPPSPPSSYPKTSYTCQLLFEVYIDDKLVFYTTCDESAMKNSAR